jgi:endonuclease YncB( thermonuclease family)
LGQALPVASQFVILHAFNSDVVLKGLEKAAREAMRGLWADPQPVPPWEWRKWSK